MSRYTTSVIFTDQEFKNPLEAAKDLANYLKEESFYVTYDVTDEDTGESFTVDLSEEDEDAVLPNKSK